MDADVKDVTIFGCYSAVMDGDMAFVSKAFSGTNVGVEFWRQVK